MHNGLSGILRWLAREENKVVRLQQHSHIGLQAYVWDPSRMGYYREPVIQNYILDYNAR